MGDAAASSPGIAASGDSDTGRSAEQQYLDRAYELLAAMESRAAQAAADAAERAPGDWDATVAHRFLRQRAASMSANLGPLCFGRIDEGGGDNWHKGRLSHGRGHRPSWRSGRSPTGGRPASLHALGNGEHRVDRRRRSGATVALFWRPPR